MSVSASVVVLVLMLVLMLVLVVALVGVPVRACGRVDDVGPSSLGLQCVSFVRTIFRQVTL